MIYHVDSKQVYWDNQGKRTGYSEERGSDKYMIFIDRPGTYLIGYKIDPSLTHTEVSRDIATKYEIDSATGATTATVDATPKVYQLESDTVYKVEVGNILHAPRHMKTGFLSPYHYWMPYPFTQQSNSTVSVKKRKLASCLDLS
jgi:hypothetical protein